MIDLLRKYRELLYTEGLGNTEVIRIETLLKLCGYNDEVTALRYEFETFVFNGELEYF